MPKLSSYSSLSNYILCKKIPKRNYVLFIILVIMVSVHKNYVLNSSPMTTVYIITPTYPRIEQIAELVRLSQSLIHVPDIVWLLVEDSEVRNPLIVDLLERSQINHQYLLGSNLI